ncbi:hypothetical protein EG327_000228, partial [Venturia inaequalis]
KVYLSRITWLTTTSVSTLLRRPTSSLRERKAVVVEPRERPWTPTRHRCSCESKSPRPMRSGTWPI